MAERRSQFPASRGGGGGGGGDRRCCVGECSLYSPREPYGDVEVERFARCGWVGKKYKIKASNRKGVVRGVVVVVVGGGEVRGNGYKAADIG